MPLMDDHQFMMKMVNMRQRVHRQQHQTPHPQLKLLKGLSTLDDVGKSEIQ